MVVVKMLGMSDIVGSTDLIQRDGKSVIIPAFSTPCKPKPEVYFGVFIPDISEIPNNQDIEKVFTDKSSCLVVMKKHHGSRFKSFNSYEEALQFAENGPLVTLSHSICGTEEGQFSSLNAEKPSPYRGPKAQDLVKFRKAIEKDDMVYFNQCINENPRYLVSSGDTPSILQEGSRYNALHIACRTNKPLYASKVLATVSQAQFFQRLYPDDTIESSERRSKYLLDCYLNTPDKGLNETPLHFASKHGSLECVRVLTSYPDCCRNRKNKFSQIPIDIVCTRSKENSQKLVSDICSLLGDHFYVPLLRDDDHCMFPQIGEPWSPIKDLPGLVTEEQQLLACLSPSSSDSPLSPITPTLKVRGYAGPMSPTQAEAFHRRWRDTGVLSPTRSSKPRSPSLRLIDKDKGLERIGRDLAASSGHNWNEYWDFLGEFTNLNTDEGLCKLEMHLKHKYKQLMMEQHTLNAEELHNKLQDKVNANLSTDQIEDNSKNRALDETDLSRSSQSTMGELCQELEALRLNASLSPHLDSSGEPVISASSKFLQQWKEREGTSENKLKDSESRKHYDPDEEYLSYIYKSIDVSAYKLAEVLGDLSRELQSSAIMKLSVSKAVQTKLKPEILCLKNVVGKCVTKDVVPVLDCGFIHIFLAFKSTEYVQSNMLPADICVLAETLKMVISNLNFANTNSSDEEDCASSTDEEKRNNNHHVSCVLRALEKAMTIAYNNCRSAESIERNENDIKMHLKQLGDCTCCWNTKAEEKYENSTYIGTPASIQKYNKAYSFVNQTLFNDNEQNSEKNKNSKISTVLPETIVKQLYFDEIKENVILASLTIGDAMTCKVESFEKKLVDEDDDDNESFATATSSLDDELLTPEEGLKVYINGLEASKMDADVLAAIETSSLDDAKYPYLAQWLHLVKSHSLAERKSWTTPYHIRGSLQVTPASRLPDLSTCTPPSRHRFWIPSSASRVLFKDASVSLPS